MNGHALRQLAEAWARVVHDGQSRKGAGEPYIEHPARVADAVWGWRRKTLAWLHDVIEDAPQPRAMGEALATVFPYDIIEDLRFLSRLPEDKRDESYQEWIDRIAASGNKDVIAVKLADINDNLADLRDIPDMQGLERRYLKAKVRLEETGA